MPEKLTRQGVRDLDAKMGKPKGGRVIEPPTQMACQHPWKAIENTTNKRTCTLCGKVWNERDLGHWTGRDDPDWDGC